MQKVQDMVLVARSAGGAETVQGQCMQTTCTATSIISGAGGCRHTLGVCVKCSIRFQELGRREIRPGDPANGKNATTLPVHHVH